MSLACCQGISPKAVIAHYKTFWRRTSTLCGERGSVGAAERNTADPFLALGGRAGRGQV
ncbi:MAG: hypothetical protein ACLRSW_07215 [Christensenellaceae bacterium]